MNVKKHPYSYFTNQQRADGKKKKKKKEEAHSSLIIDALAKLTRQVRNPGYNLRDKYFIGNICLYILRQCVLKLLQMNVKRKVSEQAVEGAEQRCSGTGRRGEDSWREGEKERKEKKRLNSKQFSLARQTN